MPRLLPTIAACLIALPAGFAAAQGSSTVDRNVGDTGPNAASLRFMDPGIARWSRETSMTDRFGQHDPQWADRTADPRLNQRYLYQAPGLTALVTRPDYAALTAEGQVVRNAQGVDHKVVQITPANVVYVLSPQYMIQTPTVEQAPYQGVDHRITATAAGNPHGHPGNAPIDGRYNPNGPANHVDIQAIHRSIQQPQGRHPELVERSRRLKEQRAKEQAEREAAADE